MLILNAILLTFGLSARAHHAPFIHAHPGFCLQDCRERSTRPIGATYPSAQSGNQRETLLADPASDALAVNTMSIIDTAFSED